MKSERCKTQQINQLRFIANIFMGISFVVHNLLKNGSDLCVNNWKQHIFNEIWPPFSTAFWARSFWYWLSCLQKSDTVKIDSSSQNAFRDSVLHLCNNHVSFHSEHEQVKELKTLHESCSFVTRKQPLVFLAFCAQKKLLLNVGEFMIP